MTLTELTAAEIADAVRARKVSPVEVTRAFLERVAAVDGAIGAFYRVDEEGALAQARAVEETIARGDDPGPLAGVPVGLKDLFVTQGLETTAGSKILEGWV